MTILIDASVFCAYANKDDVHHLKAVAFMQHVFSQTYGKALLTDYIFDESVTVALRKAGKKTALDLGNYLLNSELVLAPIESDIFIQAWKLFLENELSFTDCTSLTFSKKFNVDYVATFDKGFRGKGVKVVGV